jgi:hypothetical protein
LSDFPFSIGYGWGFPETSINLDGAMQSIWLRPINFINKVARFFHLIPEQPESIQMISDMIYRLLPTIDISEMIEEINRIQDKIEIPNPIILEELPPMVYCIDYNVTTVVAGDYLSYWIMDAPYQGLLMNAYYSPEVKNFIKFSVNPQPFIPFLQSIEIELTNHS